MIHFCISDNILILHTFNSPHPCSQGGIWKEIKARGLVGHLCWLRAERWAGIEGRQDWDGQSTGAGNSEPGDGHRHLPIATPSPDKQQGCWENRKELTGFPSICEIKISRHYPLFKSQRYLGACSVAQSCLTLWDPMDGGAWKATVHETSQARILEQVAIFCSRGSSRPRDQTHIVMCQSTTATQARPSDGGD